MKSLAIDIGASSGRHILGGTENGSLCTKEVYRFKNGVKEQDGHLIWDINSLFEEVKKGIDKALDEVEIQSLSIDTWGVDYVLLKGSEECRPVFAYRDSRTQNVIEKVHSIVPFSEARSLFTRFSTPPNASISLHDSSITSQPCAPVFRITARSSAAEATAAVPADSMRSRGFRSGGRALKPLPGPDFALAVVVPCFGMLRL